jgi:3-dehydroquinate dehydratase II
MLRHPYWNYFCKSNKTFKSVHLSFYNNHRLLFGIPFLSEPGKSAGVKRTEKVNSDRIKSSFILRRICYICKNILMKLLIINGPNLNLIGNREPELYGKQSFEAYLKKLRKYYPEITLVYYQSNIEGEIIDSIQKAVLLYDGIILNAGGYTHTSVSIADAVKAISTPVIEVHISNIFGRESFRHNSLIAPNVRGSIIGFGMESYRLAIENFRTTL